MNKVTSKNQYRPPLVQFEFARTILAANLFLLYFGATNG
jgi:hypothetical protein